MVGVGMRTEGGGVKEHLPPGISWTVAGDEPAGVDTNLPRVGYVRRFSLPAWGRRC